MKNELVRGQKHLQAFQCVNPVVEMEQDRLARERKEQSGLDKAPSPMAAAAPFTVAAAQSIPRLHNRPKPQRN